MGFVRVIAATHRASLAFIGISALALLAVPARAQQSQPCWTQADAENSAYYSGQIPLLKKLLADQDAFIGESESLSVIDEMISSEQKALTSAQTLLAELDQLKSIYGPGKSPQPPSENAAALAAFNSSIDGAAKTVQTKIAAMQKVIQGWKSDRQYIISKGEPLSENMIKQLLTDDQNGLAKLQTKKADCQKHPQTPNKLPASVPPFIAKSTPAPAPPAPPKPAPAPKPAPQAPSKVATMVGQWKLTTNPAGDGKCEWKDAGSKEGEHNLTGTVYIVAVDKGAIESGNTFDYSQASHIEGTGMWAVAGFQGGASPEKALTSLPNEAALLVKMAARPTWYDDSPNNQSASEESKHATNRLAGGWGHSLLLNGLFYLNDPAHGNHSYIDGSGVVKDSNGNKVSLGLADDSNPGSPECSFEMEKIK